MTQASLNSVPGRFIQTIADIVLPFPFTALITLNDERSYTRRSPLSIQRVLSEYTEQNDSSSYPSRRINDRHVQKQARLFARYLVSSVIEGERMKLPDESMGFRQA